MRLVPDQRVEITVEYLSDDDQNDAGVLRILTAEGGRAPAEVRLATDHKPVGGQAPCLIVAPARLDFGAVPRGQRAVRGFDLVSCGDAPVDVQAIRRGRTVFGELPPTFSLDQPPAFPLRVAPGARHRVDVAYAPRRAGLEAGHWEVTSTDPRNPTQRVDVTALANPPELGDVGLHVRLAWDTDLTDVDLHLIGPGGRMWTCEGDCYFSNPNPDWGQRGRFEDDPFLDVDDVDGFGPENINLEDPVPGTYRVLVHYWADHGGQPPRATVQILNFGQEIARYGPQPLQRVDKVWEVVEIDWPGLALRPLGGVAHQQRGNLCAGVRFP